MKIRPVIVLDWDRSKTKNGQCLKKEIDKGKFHKWGCDYEELEFEVGNYSTAIIELKDGTVLNHPAELVKFTDV